MQTFLVILLIGAMLATVAALVRGIVTFLKTTEADLKGEGPSEPGMRSNKMMQARILFQALAILIVVLILFAAGRT
ncbi:twin transmembrane helix small protein [Stakelama saccharophila]|uniref:Twin transmembrane helix small protein n=1 Tax=Stakelama saccharophila TaxID=3075605 RepID=A0ABZ0BAG2_9SPHN|nr:twin transmembrane helix small protein [Stakelama sp. W311]WNO54343.1 twin transmembrane helix small protein [Stakelama sp. W311]